METTALHQMILDNMQGGVLAIDLRGRVLAYNQAAEQILSLSYSEVVGKTFAECFLEISGSDDFVQVVLNAIYDDSVRHHQRVEFPTPRGVVVLEVTTSFLFSEQARQRIGVVAVFDDITEVESLREIARDMATLRAQQLIRAYRERGHIQAKLDPLELADTDSHPELDPAFYGIGPDELREAFSFTWGDESVRWPLQDIIQALQSTYCDTVGTQYMHIDNLEIQGWLRARIEGPEFLAIPSREQQLRIFRKLVAAESFENFLQTTFRTAKRFSLEGAETLIPLLDQAILNAADHGARDVMIGMSHRGRLNVLANVLDVPPALLFQRFNELDSGDDTDSDGDVRFHLGAETKVKIDRGRSIRISLSFNPSHLEIVGPVVMGRARACKEKAGKSDKTSVLPIVIHGDAAFAGQGIVQESLNMSRLDGYRTGGAVHVILNNQIGFTTEPDQGRSTQYPSDVARMLQIPIFHVNGESPEAVIRVVELAMDFWRTWQRDVVIDLYCYRRRGHMEQDDPSMTQPLLYKKISERQRVVERYTENILRLGSISPIDTQRISEGAKLALKGELEKAQAGGAARQSEPQLKRNTAGLQTEVPETELKILLRRLTELPANFTPHAKVKAMLRKRLSMAEGRQPVDWATGETLAYAALLAEGYQVRLSGQDSERGTFAHRHAILHDMKTGSRYMPLQHLGNGRQNLVDIHNSPLTETAVLAFEFGYSIENPASLVIWEAQFGDFANVAQVVIDQFLVSSQTKWHQSSGLVLFLPHGLEGGGPEHSSARVERFLQLCASENIDVVCLTTASQVFHRLRQQALAPTKRPLVAFTPKQAVNSRFACSPLGELAEGSFQPVVAENDNQSTKRILLCTGKIAFALAAEREARGKQARIIRLDQLYPLPEQELRLALATSPAGAKLTWVQEEPENMGAWRWLRPQLESLCKDVNLRCVARPERASPATGSAAIHQRENDTLMDRAFE